MIYLRLFLTFLKIGAVAFGGGYAMIPLMRDECLANGWLSDAEEFLDMVAIAESTPGPIAINGATYIGYRVARLPGALFGTVGVVTPSFVIIYLISLFFRRFLSVAWVASAFRGIQVAVVFLIFAPVRRDRQNRGRGELLAPLGSALRVPRSRFVALPPHPGQEHFPHLPDPAFGRGGRDSVPLTVKAYNNAPPATRRGSVSFFDRQNVMVSPGMMR